MQDGADRFAHHAAAVARELLGEPNTQLSSKDELRFGKHGSLSVDVKSGQFYDHEQKQGGGVLWFIETKAGAPVAGGKAVEWLRERGYDIEDNRPTPRAASSGGARLDPNGNWLPQRVPDHGRLAATFDYRAEDGSLAYQVCRYEWTVDPEVNPKGREKTFVQRHPDPKKPGGWSYKMEGVDPLPYRLPELIADVQAGYPVFVVEGEKKADMLRAAGVPATCNHGGAGKFPEPLVRWFDGADVILLPDNDPAGQAHMDLVGRRLDEVARRVRRLDLPGLPPKGGVDDWLPAGGSAEALYDLVAARAKLFEAAPFVSRFRAVEWLDFDKPGTSYDHLIKGVLTRGELSMLLGESQSGKSFLAIDLAMAVARGVNWFGRRVRQGGVLYQAGESATGVRRRRFPAYRQHYGCGRDPLPVVLLEGPLDLYTDDTHVEAFIDEARHWNKVLPVPLELIVIDTFNRATPGANENDGKDMGTVLARCERIRRETGAHVMLVHHLNAGGTKARGHTSLFANVENVITVKKVEDASDGDGRQIREWKVAKQKDGEDSVTTRFVLRSVEIGRDEDGDPITSCVVADPGGKTPEEEFPEGIQIAGANALVLRAIYTAIRTKGVIAPLELGLSRGQMAVERKVLWEVIKGALGDDAADMKDGETPEQAAARRDAARRQQVKRSREYLYSKAIIGAEGDWIWLTGRRVRGFEVAPGLGDAEAAAASRSARRRQRDDAASAPNDPPASDLPFDPDEAWR